MSFLGPFSKAKREKNYRTPPWIILFGARGVPKGFFLQLEGLKRH